MKSISKAQPLPNWLPFLGGALVCTYWFFQVFSSPMADGFDGYYYVMQVDQLFKTGAMHSRDFSLIYLPPTLFSTVLSPLVSYQLTVALIGFFFTSSAFVFVKKSSPLGALWVVAFLLLSPSVLFFLLQFPKNMLGLSFLLLLIASEKMRFMKAFLFILLIFTHRLALYLGVAYLLMELVSKKIKIWWLIFSLGILFLALNIPGLINIFDYKRILLNGLDLLGYWGQVSFYNLWDIWKNPSWIFDFILVHGLFLWSLLGLIKREHKVSPLFLLSLFLIFPIWEYHSGSLSYRLFLNGYLLLPILAFSHFEKQRVVKLMPFILAISLLLTVFPRYDRSKFNPPIKLYSSISQAIEQKLGVTEVDLIIAHKGIKEQIILNTDFDASNWPAEEESKHTYRVFTGINDYLLLLYLDKGEISDIMALPGGYFLTRESLFLELIKRIEGNEPDEVFRRIDTWQNPLHPKPAFL